MPQKRPPRRTSPDRIDYTGGAVARRPFVRIALILAAFILLAIAGHRLVVWTYTQQAVAAMDAGALSECQSWLDGALRLAPRNGCLYALRSRCFRRALDMQAAGEALRMAEKYRGPDGLIQSEFQLASIQTGALHEENGLDLNELDHIGATTDDLGTALIHGYLARNKPDLARIAIDAMLTAHSGEAWVAYVSGVYWRWSSEPQLARSEFERALEVQPRFEPARLAYAEMLEQQQQPEQALEQYSILSRLSPHSRLAPVSRARMMRRLGRYREAFDTLEDFNGRLEPAARMEMALVALEIGDYSQAMPFLKAAGLDESATPLQLSTAATVFSLQAEPRRAEPYLDHLLAMTGNLPSIARFSVIPATSDVRSGPDAARYDILSDDEGLPRTTEPQVARQRQLYLTHCAVCHGTTGDGSGRAARHLYPRPRNFGGEAFRIVSTSNAVPSIDDVVRVIQRGVPGTSMPAFDQWKGDEPLVLARETLRLRTAGIESRFRKALADDERNVDATELTELVAVHTTPGDRISTPAPTIASPVSVAAGQELFSKLGCRQCHGAEGKGETALLLFDDTSLRAMPRDLARTPLKGGSEFAAIYCRLAVGMPGTPHPSIPTATDEQRTALVEYCISLRRGTETSSTNQERLLDSQRRSLGPAGL
jgi:mono/diheme cytochrome c family protein/tetratricopeptide (TPR) repeat protein